MHSGMGFLGIKGGVPKHALGSKHFISDRRIISKSIVPLFYAKITRSNSPLCINAHIHLGLFLKVRSTMNTAAPTELTPVKNAPRISVAPMMD